MLNVDRYNPSLWPVRSPHEGMPKKSIIELPNDVLNTIFGMLPPRDLFRGRRVCKRFRIIIEQLPKLGTFANPFFLYRNICSGQYQYSQESRLPQKIAVDPRDIENFKYDHTWPILTVAKGKEFAFVARKQTIVDMAVIFVHKCNSHNVIKKIPYFTKGQLSLEWNETSGRLLLHDSGYPHVQVYDFSKKITRFIPASPNFVRLLARYFLKSHFCFGTVYGRYTQTRWIHPYARQFYTNSYGERKARKWDHRLVYELIPDNYSQLKITLIVLAIIIRLALYAQSSLIVRDRKPTEDLKIAAQAYRIFSKQILAPLSAFLFFYSPLCFLESLHRGVQEHLLKRRIRSLA